MATTQYLNGMGRRAAGFTLIEAVIAIVIGGILFAILSMFFDAPVRGYMDSARRAELTDGADLALRLLSREMRLALPNSVRVNEVDGVIYIEFIETSGGGRFRHEWDGSATGAIPLNLSDFTNPCATTPANCQFDVIGVMPKSPSINKGDYIVIGNAGQNSAGFSGVPFDAYAPGDPCANCNRAKVKDIDLNTNTITLYPNTNGMNVFADLLDTSGSQTASVSPIVSSPRFHVVPGDTGAVTFACQSSTSPAGNMIRAANYGFFAKATDAIDAVKKVAATTAVMATKATCQATYEQVINSKGLFIIALTLRDSAGGESVTLLREVHLDNSQ